MNNLLTNRRYDVSGNWYTPLHILKDFRSVIKAKLWDTTSSAGDWNGYFIQRIGTMFYLIPFSQVNNWPKSGFTLYTGLVIVSWNTNEWDDQDTINSIMEDYTSQ